MLVHARKGRGTVQGLEEKRAKVPWVLEEVSLYAKATSPESQFVQLQKGYVFQNSLLKGYEAQALFSHTGYEPWAHEYKLFSP